MTLPILPRISAELSQVAWIMRSIYIDEVIRNFLDKHPKATIVNIGCGMDTTFDRIDNGSLTLVRFGFAGCHRVEEKIYQGG